MITLIDAFLALERINCINNSAGPSQHGDVFTLSPHNKCFRSSTFSASKNNADLSFGFGFLRKENSIIQKFLALLCIKLDLLEKRDRGMGY